MFDILNQKLNRKFSVQIILSYNFSNYHSKYAGARSSPSETENFEIELFEKKLKFEK